MSWTSWRWRKLICNGLSFSRRAITQVSGAAARPPVSRPAAGAGAWHLYSAVCLERLPVVAPSLAGVERHLATLLRQLEFECSLKSDHEIRHEVDIATAEALRASEGDDPELAEAASVQTAADFEDACAEELVGFQPSSTFTEADRTGDVRSLDRQLSSSLVLVVRQRLGTGASWMLPQGRHEPGTTLRQTAELTLRAVLGPQIRVQFLGNAPWGFYKYKYPKPLQRESGAVGGKVFFYKAVLRGWPVGPDSDQLLDYHWLTGTELRDRLRPSYRRAVLRLLADQD